MLRLYFVAFAGLAAGFAAALAVVCSEARSARVLTRLAAFDRLRVFLRALVFGMVRLLECLVTSYAIERKPFRRR